MTFILFLRGINVGGNKKVSMSILKKLILTEGFINVRTHLNSGNIIVSTYLEKSDAQFKIQKIIAEHFNINPCIMIFTIKEIKDVIESDPFDLTPNLFSKKCVGFTQSNEAIENNTITDFTWTKEYEEDIYFIGPHIYIYYINGQAKTKLTTTFLEKKMNRTITIRNWNTLLKVYQIALEVSI